MHDRWLFLSMTNFRPHSTFFAADLTSSLSRFLGAHRQLSNVSDSNPMFLVQTKLRDGLENLGAKQPV